MPIRRTTRLLLFLAVVAVVSAPVAEAQRPGGRAPVRDAQRLTAKRVWSWQEINRRHIVMQQRDYSCGAAALATMARFYLGDPVDEDYFLNQLDDLLTDEEVVDRIENGLSLADLRRVAVASGYEAVVNELSFQQLSEARVPLLVGIEVDEYKHFVVYRGTNYRWVYLADPARGHVRMTPNEFNRAWQRNLTLAIAKPDQDVPQVHPLSLTPGDLFWGETNDQLIRTQPQRGSVHQPRATRP